MQKKWILLFSVLWIAVLTSVGSFVFLSLWDGSQSPADDIDVGLVPDTSLSGQEQLQWLLNGDFQRLSAKLDPLLDPGSGSADVDLESVMQATARPEHAVGDQLNAWVEAMPKSGPAHLLRANYRMRQGVRARGTAYISGTSQSQLDSMHRFFSLSRQDLDVVKSLRPQSAYPYAIELEMAMRASGPTPSAEVFEAGVSRDPDLVWLYLTNLARLAPKWGGSDPARESFISSVREQYARHPHLKAVEVQWRLDSVAALPGEPCDKIDAYRSVYQFHRNASSAYYLGRAYSCDLQLDKALPFLEQSVEAWPYMEKAWRVIGSIEHARGHHEKALEATHRAVYLNPQDAFAHFQEGEIAMYTHRYEQAETAFHNAALADDDPFHYSQYQELARAFAEEPGEAHELVVLKTEYGPMLSRTPYRNGRKEGVGLAYKDNRPSEKRQYVNDRIVHVSVLNDDEQVVSEIDMDLGKTNGPFTEYSETGKVISRGQMIRGHRHGEIRVFFENGQPVFSNRFEAGKRLEPTKFFIPETQIGDLNVAAVTTSGISRIQTPLDRTTSLRVDYYHPIFLYAAIYGIEEPGHRIAVTFSDPDGREAYHYEQALQPGQERFNSQYVYCNPNPKHDKPGEWQVDVLIDGQVAHRIPISVSYQ